MASSTPDPKAAPAPAGPNDGGLTVSQDVFANPDVKALASIPTVTGKDGIERIAGPAVDNWEPAPVHATDEAKAAAEQREVMFAEAKAAREEALTVRTEAAKPDGKTGDPSKA